MTSTIIIIAIIVAIGLGYVTKINTGLYAISFAYLIGTYVMGLSPSKITAMWPMKLFFIIFAVSLFYNFSMSNGTLEKVAMHILYKFRRNSGVLSYIVFFIATLIAGMGAGYFAVMAFLCPIALLLCKRSNMSTVEGVIAVSFGALAGANFMTSMSGLIFRGLIDAAGYQSQSFVYCTSIFIMTLLIPILLLTGLKVLNKKGRQESVLEIAKPEKFNKKQRYNLYLIVALIVIVLLPPLLHSLLPTSNIITMINKYNDVGYVAVLLSVVGLLLKLADEKQVISRVPWGTLIMICGVGMLIGIAVKAGTIKLLAGWITQSIPPFFVPVVIAAIAGVMSFFSSTLGVVAPTLFPIVPILAEETGINPMVLFTCIVMSSQSTGGVSPFSSGGSLALSSCENQQDVDELFKKLMFVATPALFIIVLCISFVYGLLV